jgi:hypothetical protein
MRIRAIASWRRACSERGHAKHTPVDSRALECSGWLWQRRFRAARRGPDAGSGSGSGSTIHIHMDGAPAQVMVRDGVDAPWQAAMIKSSTSFEATIHGPYLVSVVCKNLRAVAVAGHHTQEWQTWQAARTPEDSTDLVAPCIAPSEVHGVIGHMVQAGTLQLGELVASSATPDWERVLFSTAGKHDLIATTADRIAVRRDVEVPALGDPPPLAAIDVERDGLALVDAAFTAANAKPDEVVAASVNVATKTTHSDTAVYRGGLATAKVAPSAALVATDAQTVTVSATRGTSVRSLRRPFRVGGAAGFTLPAAITNGQWLVEAAGIGVSWSALPALAPDDALTALIDAATTDPAVAAVQELDVSPRFIAATKLVHAVIDTSIPGFEAAWKPDVTQPYTRTLRAEHVANGELSASTVTELSVATLTAPAPGE